jgi:hypothetical protein
LIFRSDYLSHNPKSQLYCSTRQLVCEMLGEIGVE